MSAAAEESDLTIDSACVIFIPFTREKKDQGNDTVLCETDSATSQSNDA